MAHAPESFALVPGGMSVTRSLASGLFWGLMAMPLVQRLELGEPWTMLAGLFCALAAGTVSSVRQRRAQPDRLDITADRLELWRGDRRITGVRLDRLLEVNELPLPEGEGPLLLLADDRRVLVLPAERLVRPADYPDITAAVVDRLAVLDPSGELGRRAVAAARLRERLSGQRAWGAHVLLGLVGVGAFLLSFLRMPQLTGQPFPLELSGALSHPLVVAGEWWRLTGYAFVHTGGLHLAAVLLGILWLGGHLERLLGWERMLLGFTAGVLGAAVGQLAGGWPVAGVGATGGVFGFLGLMAAVSTVGRRRLPRALHPRRPFWVVAVGLGALVSLTGSLSLVAHGAAVLAGWLLGWPQVAGEASEEPDQDRSPWRPFALVAAAALAVGFVGALWHPKMEHGVDTERVADAYLALPDTMAAAVAQNEAAYLMLMRPAPSPESLDVGLRLAQAAVDASGRREPAVLDTLAVARYRSGDRDGACEILEDALQLEAPAPVKALLERRLELMRGGGELPPEWP